MPAVGVRTNLWVVALGAGVLLVLGSLMMNVIFASSPLASSIRRAAIHLPGAARYIARWGNQTESIPSMVSKEVEEAMRSTLEENDELRGRLLQIEATVKDMAVKMSALIASKSPSRGNGGVSSVRTGVSATREAHANDGERKASSSSANLDPSDSGLPPVFPEKPEYPKVGKPVAQAAIPTPKPFVGRVHRNPDQIMGDDLSKGNGRRIFIDLGANCGNSYNAIKDESGKTKYDIAYLWELNQQLVRAYLLPLEKVDPAVRIVPNPAWGEDTNMTFYMDNRDDGMTDEEIIKRYPCKSKRVNTRNTPSDSSTFIQGQKFGRAGRAMVVQAIGFPKWFRSQGFTKDDVVHLKVDIEGAECSVLNAFMDEGLLCEVKKVMVEWHQR